jgi:hypothetical protein
MQMGETAPELNPAHDGEALNKPFPEPVNCECRFSRQARFRLEHNRS